MKQSFALGMEKIGTPCINININGIVFCFLIDTGSSENHLIDYTYQFLTQYFGDVITEEKGDCITSGLGGSYKCKRCSFEFTIGRTKYEDSFVALPNSEMFFTLSDKLGATIAGILGGRFLKKNHIVIDYDNNCLYSKRMRKSSKTAKAPRDAA